MSRSLSPTEISLASARRIALAAQGFHTSRPTGRVDRRQLRRVVDTVGLIQIDSVNALVRSQELPLFSRLGNHPRSLIADATAAGELFEYWCHAASHLPITMYPLMYSRMQRARTGVNVWTGILKIVEKNPALVEEIRSRVEESDGLVAGEVSTRVGPKDSWWDWDNGKAILEYLFWIGEITAQRRPRDFARVYHPIQRVIPQHILSIPPPSYEEATKELLIRAARCHGIATAKDLFDYHHQKPIDARAALQELVDSSELEQVRVEGWKEVAYLHPEVSRPRAVSARALVSPFDSLVWCRPRIERLFDFHYRIEIYTPESKRIYGYYVLPFVLGERIVARVDLKADRQAGVLLVPGIYSEPGVDIAHVVTELLSELKEMATWLGLHSVHIGTRGDLSALLAKRNRQK